MGQRLHTTLDRRDVLRALAGTAVAASAPAAADSESDSEKRKPRYQPNSPEVQTFYRVNRYPGR